LHQQGELSLDDPLSKFFPEFPNWAGDITIRHLVHLYEVDPLLCPFCGGEMKILAFITDFAIARAIRRSLKLPAQEPEPLAHGPPHELELLDQIA
jgi:hypothetical protein